MDVSCERAQSVMDRDQRIGVLRSLVDLCLTAEQLPVLEKRTVSLKELCSDFIVREVSNATGQPLSLEAPLPTPASVGSVSAGQKRTRQQRAAEAAHEAGGDSDTTADAARAEQIRQAFQELVTADELSALLSLTEQDSTKVVIASVTEKPKRALLHAAVKLCFAGTHISTTENGVVAVVKSTAADRREERRRSNPLRSRPYLHFTLYKENMDSAYAFRSLAKSLHVSARQFQYCGTKDKRAVTLQRVAIRDMAPSRLAVVNEHTYGHSKMKVCSFTEETEGLRLGDAHGNRFEIVLRCLPSESGTAIEDTWLASVERCLSTTGAINYYGPQRFGTTKVLTSDVGVLLLRGDFDAALYQCLESKSAFAPDVAHALEPLRAGRYEEALEKLPHFCYQERDMVKHLIAHPNDFVGAFLTLPRTLAMLYFHAVQSLVWNTMASARLADETRLNVEAGDLVLEEVYRLRLQTRQRAATQAVFSSCLSEGQTVLPAVRRLTAEDPLDLFALADVLLPVPGPDDKLVFPTSHGCAKESYQAKLAELGVQEALLPADAATASNLARTNALIKVFHFHGTYRPLSLVPVDMKLERRVVSGWRTPVTVTDLAALDGTSAADTQPEVADNGELSGPCECILASFSLPPGSYATSVLREFAVLCADDVQAKRTGNDLAQTVDDTEADAVPDTDNDPVAETAD